MRSFYSAVALVRAVRERSTAIASGAARGAELAAVALDDGRGTAAATDLALDRCGLVLDYFDRVGQGKDAGGLDRTAVVVEDAKYLVAVKQQCGDVRDGARI